MSLIPTVAEALAASQNGTSVGTVAACFHETAAQMPATAADAACQMSDVQIVGLSGGCFANRRLPARLVGLLETRGLRVLYHRQVPCGDGDVDADDYAAFVSCFTGTGGGPVDPECEAGDFDYDGDIDCDDWTEFKLHWTGPPAEPPFFSTCDLELHSIPADMMLEPVGVRSMPPPP